jgi:hypothetical protein
MFLAVFIHYSPKVEATLMSINWQIGKQNVIYPYNGILFTQVKSACLVSMRPWVPWCQKKQKQKERKENVLKLTVVLVNILKIIELYALNSWLVWYVNYISTKLCEKKINGKCIILQGNWVVWARHKFVPHSKQHRNSKMNWSECALETGLGTGYASCLDTSHQMYHLYIRHSFIELVPIKHLFLVVETHRQIGSLKLPVWQVQAYK